MSILSKITFDNPRGVTPVSRLRMQKYYEFLEQQSLYTTFFEKSFKSGLFWGKMMGASEGRINLTNA